jgi:hypothetical protein
MSQFFGFQVLQGGDGFSAPDGIRGLAEGTADVHGFSLLLMTIKLK